MRFLLTFLIWVLFVGGLFFYTSRRDAASISGAAAVPEPEATKTERLITIELTPTFSTEEDPFALKTGVPAAPLEVRLNGVSLAVAGDQIGRGRTVTLRDVSTALADHNELFVKASPPMGESSLDHGIRVRLLDGARILADRTIWSSGGGLVSGSVGFQFNDGGTRHDR